MRSKIGAAKPIAVAEDKTDIPIMPIPTVSRIKINHNFLPYLSSKCPNMYAPRGLVKYENPNASIENAVLRAENALKNITGQTNAATVKATK